MQTVDAYEYQSLYFYLCIFICTPVIILKMNLYSMCIALYYARTFQGRDPGVMIFDIDMLKDVLVKDASNFRNRYVRYYVIYRWTEL